MQAVEDLLNDYKRYGSNINVDFIDPDASPAKTDGLIKEVTTKYGGEVRSQGLSGQGLHQNGKSEEAPDDESAAVANLPLARCRTRN